MSVPIDLQFDPRYGEAIAVAEGVQRVTAPNASAMTFCGTNTYLVGRERVVVIDPGPADDRHLAALEQAIGDRSVAAILLTHGHADHSALVPEFRDRTGAPVLASAHCATAKDIELEDGQRVSAGDMSLEVVATPGHARDHLSFALPLQRVLFSGDHVMAWATTVIAAPDGRMADYMASLDRLMHRSESVYFPGHGGPVERVQTVLRALKAHRRMREASILTRLEAGPAGVDTIVDDLYRSLDPALRSAARLSVLAHLEDLCERGRVRDPTRRSGDAAYELVPLGIIPPA